MDSRIVAYFCLTTFHAVSDAFIYEDWSLFLISMAVWRFAVLAGLALGASAAPKESRERVRYLSLVFAVPILGCAYYWFGRMPFTWESDLWSAQADVVVVTWLLLYGGGDASSDSNNPNNAVDIWLSPTIQEMYASYYTAAGFWKINSHFLDPAASCATVFFCQHIATVFSRVLGLDFSTQLAVARAIAPYAPVGTVIVELCMGVALAAGVLGKSRHLTKMGMLLILYFHLAVCVTPPPNNISQFALMCTSRLVLVTDPHAISRVATKLKPHVVPLSVAAVLATAYGLQQSFEPLDWSFLMYAPVLVFLHWTLAEEGHAKTTLTTKTSKTPTATAPSTKSTRPSARRPLWMRAATAFAIFYSFGTMLLGIMEEATCNMFANLRIHGGSNHLLLPTGLLFRWFRHAGDAHPYGGGEIRLETTTSNWLQEIYPNDMTHVLQPAPITSDLLQAATGVPAPHFMNAGANRVLGLRERGWLAPPPHGNLLQYSVPSLEWKRLLSEAMDRDGDFDVTYAHLPGVGGDEVWRATAFERRVVLRVRANTINYCRVQFSNGTRTECGSDDLPYNLQVPWWVQKMGLYHGYPILYNSDGTVRKSIQCFGP